MKYRPSKRVIWLAIPLVPVAFMLVAFWCADTPDTQALATRGSKPPPPERKFSVVSPSSWSTAFETPADWLDQGFDLISRAKLTPWQRESGHYLGENLMRLKASADPADQAKYRELLRLGQEWQARLLARFPELAPKYRDVPDDKNGLLRWNELAASLTDTTTNPPRPKNILPIDFWSNLTKKWDPTSAQSWLDANRPLLDEIRAIGQMTERSSKGFDYANLLDGNAIIMRQASQALMLDARIAAGQGDFSRMQESLRAANGLADHFVDNDSPVLIQWLVGCSIHRGVEQFIVKSIIPELPPEQAAGIDWQGLVTPPSRDPEVLPRVTLGEWNAMMASYLLPSLSDSAEPMMPADADRFVEMLTLYHQAQVLAYQDATVESDGTTPQISADLSGLSWKSRKLAEDMGLTSRFDAVSQWRKNQTNAGFYQAALAIYNGQPAPRDPVSGLDYRWNETTRQLSLPPGVKSGPKPIIVPKR